MTMHEVWVVGNAMTPAYRKYISWQIYDIKDLGPKVIWG